VIHQFGTVGIDTLNSTINTFTNPNMERVASAHFVVSGNRIVQMVSLDDRAYHAGSVGNDFIGIETDPAQDAATVASTRKLLAALNAKYGYKLQLIRHKDVQGNTTSCGSLIDLARYVVEESAPTPAPIDEAKVIGDFLDWLKDEYLKR
jgi:N-acetylmuramoyl-L-alanine amidase CwlA